MKKIVSFLALSLLLLFSSYTPFGNEGDQKNTLLLKIVLQGLEQYHFQPRTIDDQFSEQVFTQFLDKLDNSKRFLLAADVEQLRRYRRQIDDQIKADDFAFYNAALGLITRRMAEAATYYEAILSQPFDLTVTENFERDFSKLSYPRTQQELRERWRKLLKYQTITRLARTVERQRTAVAKNDTTVAVVPLATLEAQARNEVRKSQQEFFHRLGQLEARDWYAAYLNAIMETYDPHTGYFPPEDKENFDISISGQLEGIGASLSERDGFIKVERIVPGSASWQQGELKEGDVILKVGQGNEDAVDVVDMRLDQAVRLIRGPKGSEVRLTVRKLDGTIVTVPIVRDIVVLEETYAQSALLEADGRQVGYIKLPKFYADFNREGGRSSAEDVKKELIRLKTRGVSGVVLDLRNNGGGSLQDVVEMAGLFIAEGPIVQVKGRTGAPYVMQDRDPQVVYDGPLLIMVNTFSASASEILAAAMQDYGRALVVGNASFGKGTVQRFFNLDDAVPPAFNAFKPLGAIKLTTQKFYRINGGATQLKGVTPDIILPDNYTFLEVGEREQAFAMPWDEIQGAPFTLYPTYADHFGAVIRRSNGRVGENNYFSRTSENARRLRQLNDQTQVPLQLEAYLAEQERLEAEADAYQLLAPPAGLTVRPLGEAGGTLPADTVSRVRNERWVEALGKDVYVAESFHVLEDINL